MTAHARQATRTARDPVGDIYRAVDGLFRLRSSRKVHARQIVAAGVSISQPGHILLKRVQEDGPISLGELAKLTEMDPAACGRQIRQLEAEGYVERAATGADRRVIAVRSTAKGSRARQRIAEVLDRHMEEVLSSWSAQDQERLAELLGRLVDDFRAVQYRTLGDKA
jgi:DNA-binding MarR family transcriptional regulator